MADKKNNQERKKLQNILQEPLTRHRVQLATTFRAAQSGAPDVEFSMEDLKTFISTIPGQNDDFKYEIQNVLEALQSGKAPKRPQINSPSKQVLWGAALTYLSLNPDQLQEWDEPTDWQGLEKSKLWKQLTESSYATQELLSHSQNVEEVLRHRKTEYKWGKPGTGVGYDPNSNKINIDFMHCLVVGFEHARADVCREIGYAYLSRSYPERMQKVYKDMAPLLAKSRKASAKKGPQLSKDEYKQLRLLSAEWQLRHMMFKAAEGNTVNKYVDNLGQVRMQDFGVSLNNSAVTSEGIGFMPPPKKGANMSEELARYLNLVHTVRLSFFQHNGLFDHTDKSWKQAGVDSQQVRTLDTMRQRGAQSKDGITHKDFQQLLDLCRGDEGLENLQPKQHERLYGDDVIERKIRDNDKKRNQIVTHIWDLYAEELIEKILDQTADQIDQQLENNEENQDENKNDHLQNQDGPPEQQDGDPQSGDPQSGDPQSGDPQSGDPQSGDPQSGDPQSGDPQSGDPQSGDPQSGDPQSGDPQSGDPQSGDPQSGDPQSGDPQSGDPQSGDPQSGDQQDGQDGDPQAGDQQDGQDGQGQDGPSEEGKLGTDDDSTVPVDGAGDMPGVEDAAENPSDEMSQDGQSQDGDGQDGEGQDGQDGDGQDGPGEEGDGQDGDGQGQTADDLQKQLEQALQDEANGDSQDGDGQDGQDGPGEDGEGQDGQDGQDGQSQDGQSGDPSESSDQAGQGEGKSLSELAKQDWTQYEKRIAELRGPIMQTRKIFKRVQELQMQNKKKKSQSMDILPQDGEVMDRFNMEAHKNLTIKKAIGDVQEDDLKRFHLDDNFEIPTEVDIMIMIDGSGSMGMGGGGSTSPLESALQAAAILYEAAAGKDMKMNVYVGMWGDSNAPIKIKPGDNRKQIGQVMQSMRQGLHSGTDMAPAIKRAAETVSEQRGKSGTLSGFTHILVISDGDIGDEAASRKNLESLFKYCDKATVDTAIIKPRGGSQMEQMAKNFKGRKPHEEIGTVIENKGDAVPMAIVGLLLNKIRKCGSFSAVPNNKKRRDMKKAANDMKKNGGGRRFN